VRKRLASWTHTDTAAMETPSKTALPGNVEHVVVPRGEHVYHHSERESHGNWAEPSRQAG
jgi:hypothetical protein